MTNEYAPQQIEQQVQQYWENNQCFTVTEDESKEKYYSLAMFPYPSGKLHIGHARVYTINDLIARFYRMKGKQVLNPIGWDAFGLPAENAAIEKGDHPAKWTYSNIDHMRQQLKRLGCSYDWQREFATCDPDYYKWEQWLFIQMFKRGLAYRKESWVNWDPVDQTVLANEQVEEGRGWRSGALVERKKLPQWYIRITSYADELLADLDTLDWPSNIVTMQKNWIGKSQGVEIDFPIADREDRLRVFTTRPDTIMGATYMAIAADHPLMDELCANNRELEQFAAKCRLPKERSEELPKEGMFTGLYVKHPLTGKQLPIWTANFVLMEYGTGAIMSVPGHDQRDWEFAKAYNLPIKQVIAPARQNEDNECDIDQQAYCERGVCVNSDKYDGLDFAASSNAIVEDLKKVGLGNRKTTYRLRDWGVSRQRYWGAPIPIIHCPKCGEVAVPEDQLPVELPRNVTISGRGSPLASLKEFVETTCPQCGGNARRDTDTFDTFFESSWYQSRFASFDCDTTMLDWRAKHWCPVDQYVGGIEHAILHLLYARFFHKFMRDCLVDENDKPILTSNEPFTSLLAQGMVLGPMYQRHEDQRTIYANEIDLQVTNTQTERYGIHRQDGQRYEYLGIGKMSKSKGNGVDPDRVIEQYGADTLRLFLLFTSPPEQSLEWSESGVVGMYRYLKRLWLICDSYKAAPRQQLDDETALDSMDSDLLKLWRKAHQTIRKVNDDIVRRKTFNTAIAAIMELTNSLQKFSANEQQYPYARKVAEYLLQMLAPFTPHICDTLWQHMGYKAGELLDCPYPQEDSKACEEDEITLIVQVNGKLRARIQAAANSDSPTLEALALQHSAIQPYLEGNNPRKIIVVPNKLVNLVI